MRNYNVPENPVDHRKSGMPDRSSHMDRPSPHDLEAAQSSSLGMQLLKRKIMEGKIQIS